MKPSLPGHKEISKIKWNSRSDTLKIITKQRLQLSYEFSNKIETVFLLWIETENFLMLATAERNIKSIYAFIV